MGEETRDSKAVNLSHPLWATCVLSRTLLSISRFLFMCRGCSCEREREGEGAGDCEKNACDLFTEPASLALLSCTCVLFPCCCCCRRCSCSCLLLSGYDRLSRRPSLLRLFVSCVLYCSWYVTVCVGCDGDALHPLSLSPSRLTLVC